MLTGAGFLLLYLVLAPRVAGDGDSGELTVVLATLGLAHPTGYAFYTLLGHAFVVALHAIGAGWEWAANAWSALGGAVAVGLWHRFATHALVRAGVRPRSAGALALLPAIGFGTVPAWTGACTLAEVTSWHMAWVAAACVVALRLLEPPARRVDGGIARAGGAMTLTLRLAAGWGALMGLGLSHHATSLWLALPLGIAVAWRRRPPAGAWLAALASGLAVLLAAWGYVLFRSLHPAAMQWGSLVPGLRGTWEHVTAAGYRHYLGGFAPSPEQSHTLATEVFPWLLPGLAAIAVWAFAAEPRARAGRIALLAAALLQCGYPFIYGVSDPVSYFLPSQALGTFLIPAAIAGWLPARRLGRALAVAGAVGVLIAGWGGWNAARERNQSLESLDALLRQMWEAIPIRRGWVVWDDDMSARLTGYQLLRHERAGVVVVRPRLLMDQGARTLFARRHGVDPLSGASPPADEEADRPERIREFADLIATGLNRAGADSVILFLPAEPSLRLLPKGGPAPSAR